MKPNQLLALIEKADRAAIDAANAMSEAHAAASHYWPNMNRDGPLPWWFTQSANTQAQVLCQMTHSLRLWAHAELTKP